MAECQPDGQAEPPPAPAPDPQPPTPDEAARLIAEAGRTDPDWGMFVWLTMVTGARRGELCGLRWRHIDLDRGVITIRRAIAQDGTATEEKDTKTQQRRHVTIDPGTVDALREHRHRWEARTTALDDGQLSPDAFVFSNAPDGTTSLKPSSVTQRYGRMAGRLGIATHLHNLRHYSATELIAAGVDVRTVAGRLGHGGGGTTLRVYAAWVAEADQRAAQGLADRLPARPVAEVPAVERAKAEPRSPFERPAADLRTKILRGEIAPSVQLPTGKQLGAEYGVATATAQRAVTLLQTWGLVEVSRGRRAVVRGVGAQGVSRKSG